MTLAKLGRGDFEYLTPQLVTRYGLYLSFTGGPTLDRIEQALGLPCARAFHCLVDPDAYPVIDAERRWHLGYLGTYSDDRQPALERLLLEPARRDPALRCVVAGPSYPDDIAWPANVQRIEHLPPADHPAFYSAQRFTVNVTRADMVAAGWSPSVRLFEAAACAVPVISDPWDGLDTFFEPGAEIVVAHSADDVLRTLADTDHAGRDAIGRRARDRVLAQHTAERRAAEFEQHVSEAMATA